MIRKRALVLRWFKDRNRGQKAGRSSATRKRVYLLEGLEPRQLLAGSTPFSTLQPAASAPIWVSNLAKTRDPLNRLTSDLKSLVSYAATKPTFGPQDVGQFPYILFDRQNRVGLNITTSNAALLTPELLKLNFQITASLPERHLIEGYLPVNSLSAAAGLGGKGLLGIMPIYKPMTS